MKRKRRRKTVRTEMLGTQVTRLETEVLFTLICSHLNGVCEHWKWIFFKTLFRVDEF